MLVVCEGLTVKRVGERWLGISEMSTGSALQAFETSAAAIESSCADDGTPAYDARRAILEFGHLGRVANSRPVQAPGAENGEQRT